MSQVFAYVRVSTKEQNEDRQLIAISGFNISASNIFLDKQSGKDFNRPAYLALIARLCPGDLIIVKSVDRLGRNYDEIIEQWRIITKEKLADILVLDMPLLDTRQGRDLTGTLIADIVLQLLSYVAQTERENLRQRQAEGIAAARARGVRFGKEKKPLPDSFPELYTRWKNGEIAAAELALLCGISRRTLFRRLRSGRDTQLN